MTSIAIIAPDGNRVVSLSADLPLADLIKTRHNDPRVTRIPAIDTSGDWPFQFDRVYVASPTGWRGYAPDDLPVQYW